MSSYGDSFGVDERFDLSHILNNNQQSNLDDFINFRIYCDEIEFPINDRDQRLGSTTDLSLNKKHYSLNRLISIHDQLDVFCSQYAWTCQPLIILIDSDEDDNQPMGQKRIGKRKSVRFEEGSVRKNICLHGLIRIGDNCQEEWLVVYMLWELSRLMPDISITVNDIDGELLLIECADHIPQWLDPSKSEHRVWIRNSQLQIIPKSRSVSSVAEAIHWMMTDPLGCVAKHSAQQCILKRIKPFEQIVHSWIQPYTNIESNFMSLSSLCLPYHCRIVVPLPIALLLHRYPHLLGVAIDNLPIPDSADVTKYLKEQQQTKDKLQSIKNPIFDCSDVSVPVVCFRVALNRGQYARLKSLRFRIPSQFSSNRWPINENIDSKQMQRFQGAKDRGAKICLGLLSAFCANCRNPSACSAFFWDRMEIKKENKSLNKFRRFLSLLESSVIHNEKSSETKSGNASSWFIEMQELLAREMRNSDGVPSIENIRFKSVFIHCYEEVINEIREASMNEFCNCRQNEETVCSKNNCRGFQCCDGSDDEQWLEVNSDEVNKLISERQKDSKVSNNSKKINRRDKDIKDKKDAPLDKELDDLFQKFNNLLNKESGFEGIEEEGRKDYTYLEDDDDSDDEDDEDDDDDDRDDDEDEFMGFHDKFLAQSDMDDEMREIMKLMDKELKQFKNTKGTQERKSYEVFDTENVPFRRSNPMEMDETELSTELKKNLQKSREHENLLEPGPATIMMKQLGSP